MNDSPYSRLTLPFSLVLSLKIDAYWVMVSVAPTYRNLHTFLLYCGEI